MYLNYMHGYDLIDYSIAIVSRAGSILDLPSLFSSV